MLHSPQSGGKEMDRIPLILLPAKRDLCKYFLTKIWVPVFGVWCFLFLIPVYGSSGGIGKDCSGQM